MTPKQLKQLTVGAGLALTWLAFPYLAASIGCVLIGREIYYRMTPKGRLARFAHLADKIETLTATVDAAQDEMNAHRRALEQFLDGFVGQKPLAEKDCQEAAKLREAMQAAWRKLSRASRALAAAHEELDALPGDPEPAKK